MHFASDSNKLTDGNYLGAIQFTEQTKFAHRNAELYPCGIKLSLNLPNQAWEETGKKWLWRTRNCVTSSKMHKLRVHTWNLKTTRAPPTWHKKKLDEQRKTEVKERLFVRRPVEVFVDDVTVFKKPFLPCF